MAQIKLKSKYFGEVTDRPLQEYPRPQLVRLSYKNLNGLWDYAIYKKTEAFSGYEGKILVPFSPESLLSRVERTVTPDDFLYYRLNFAVEEGFLKEKTLLHFGAVDYECEVSLNGEKVGENKGGFFAFTLDVTSAIKVGENELTLKVSDPTDKGVQGRGKQMLAPFEIWYTAQSGIWQTVWLESVDECFVESLKITPNIDDMTLTVEVESHAKEITVTATDFGRAIASERAENGKAVLSLQGAMLWSPENPKLYDLEITADTDKVTSYFAMRKFGVGEDKRGVKRLMLNNKPYFHKGLLDQGYYSDGLLTPPTDGAMEDDVKLIKEMGFNMLRKHIKIEPMRWYYHCDRLGVLVWQDMINGGSIYDEKYRVGVVLFNWRYDDTKNYDFMSRADAGGRLEFVEDMRRIVKQLYNCPCISLWTVFNEGWGQFDSERVSNILREMDSTRTIDNTSGWNDQGGGELKSLHIYKVPMLVHKDKRCIVLSEFGGFTLRVPKHVDRDDEVFSYGMFKTEEKLIRRYERAVNEVCRNIRRGISASVYTQVSDVEREINGLVTYDRAVVKFDKKRMCEINSRLKLEE